MARRMVLVGVMALGLLGLILIPGWMGDEERVIGPGGARPEAVVWAQTKVLTPTTVTVYLPVVLLIPLPSEVRIKHIEYNPPGLDSVGEYVELVNLGPRAEEMTGWRLVDGVETTFIFPEFSLVAGAKVRIWVRSGVNDGSNLYWGRDTATWGNTGDTAILRDKTGTEVDRCSYDGGGNRHTCF